MSTDYPTNLDTWTSKTPNVDDCCASHLNDLQDAIVALETKVGITNSGVDTTMAYKVHNFFDDAGTRTLYLYENTAPTGWTTVSAASDVVLAVKGGSNDYNASGGTVAGSWLSPSYSLVASELPEHTHTYTRYYGAGYFLWQAGGFAVWYSSGTLNTGSTGSGDAHRHGTNEYRPYSVVGIIVKYDGE